MTKLLASSFDVCDDAIMPSWKIFEKHDHCCYCNGNFISQYFAIHMSVAIPKLTLVYFGFANRAEPIRLAAAIGRIAFTNKSIQYQDFSSHKDELPLGQLPILEIESGGKKLVIPQAHAILRYFGKLGGKCMMAWHASVCWWLVSLRIWHSPLSTP